MKKLITFFLFVGSFYTLALSFTLAHQGIWFPTYIFILTAIVGLVAGTVLIVGDSSEKK